MILCIGDLLSAAELQQVNDGFTALPFTDGRQTAGWHARLVKNNEQAAAGDEQARYLDQLIKQALQRHGLFQSAALPKAIQPFLLARYRETMNYGLHVDDALMAQGTFRADIAVTVFLNATSEYDGGELVLDSTAGEQVYKLEAGQAVMYPANTLHQVTAVTRGERRVAVTWVQSLVRQAEHRGMLFELDMTRRQLFENYGKISEFDKLSRVYANLLRQWVEP